MTEEQFKIIKELKDSIDKMESKINTIELLLESNNLSCKVEGVSDCKFKVTRYIYLNEENLLKILLENQKQIFTKELISLKEKFSNL